MAKMMPMVVVVLLLALILNTNPVRATDCLSVVSNIFSCRNYLENPIPISPGNQCCDAVRNINAVGNGDIDSLCKCLSQNYPFGSGFLPSKARQLPGVCNLSGLLPLVNCLAPTSVTESSKDITIPFPPLAPGLLPPISLPFPPLAPGLLPPISLPFPPLAPGLLPPISLPFPPLAPGLLPPISLPFPPLAPGLLPPISLPFPPLAPGLLPPIPFPFPPLTPGLLPPTSFFPPPPPATPAA